uniref:Inositol polyphosphate-related phosphatase domain-containing protein n=1 Tax=Timema monikensis TaxID=170555 RepID=A0A7R9HMI4_9NEOP|nr:unnamed protein product [Timema monikensis]
MFSEKNRAPAWCDRILWRGDGIQQVEYRSHPKLNISDHKAVSSLFDSQIRVIDAVKYRKVHEDVMKKLDKLENEFLPQVMVDNTEVIFETVRYLESQTKDLIIANTGQVLTHLSSAVITLLTMLELAMRPWIPREIRDHF